MDSLLEFWRQHGEPLLKSSPYHEIPPHLVLMAFLHRVVNGSGTFIRAQWAQLLITSSLWAIALFKDSHIPSHIRKPLPHIAKSLIGKFIKNFVKNSLQI